MLNRNRAAGFTIVELLIAAAVFVILVTLVVDLFLLFLRSSYEHAEQEQLEQSISYVMFELASHLHSDGIIDYSRYSTITNPQTELYTMTYDALSSTTIFLGTGTPPNEEAGQIYAEDVATGLSEPLTPDPIGDIYVDSLEFYIYPGADPYDPTVSPTQNNQPTVLVRIKAHSAEDATMTSTYQSLITSRYYAR